MEFPSTWQLSKAASFNTPFLYETTDLSFSLGIQSIKSFPNEGPGQTSGQVSEEQLYINGGALPSEISSSAPTVIHLDHKLFTTKLGLRGFLTTECVAPNGPSFGIGFITFVGANRVVFNYTKNLELTNNDQKAFAEACSSFAASAEFKQQSQTFQDILATLSLK